MIHHGFVTHQAVNGGDVDSFYKELLTAEGQVPLSIVRKRHLRHRSAQLPAILLIHGFGQNRYAWHLPSRSFANHLARSGFDVFNLDLRGHGRSRELGPERVGRIEEYYQEDLPAAIHEVRSHIGNAPLFLVGHSLGGLVSYAAAPGLGQTISGIATIGSPFAFGDGWPIAMRALRLAARFAHNYKLNPNVPLSFREVGTALRSIRVFAETRLYPVPVRGWHRGALEPLVLDEHLRLAFDHAGFSELTELMSARLFREGSFETEAFARIDKPLLVIAGTNDDLAPPASVKKAFDRSLSKRKSYVELPFGHIDLLVGRDAPKTTWQTVADWATEIAKSP